MRQLQLCFLVVFALSVTLLPGCGRDSTAKPVVETDEISAYLAENPEADTDTGPDAEDMEYEEDE